MSDSLGWRASVRGTIGSISRNHRFEHRYQRIEQTLPLVAHQLAELSHRGHTQAVGKQGLLEVATVVAQQLVHRRLEVVAQVSSQYLQHPDFVTLGTKASRSKLTVSSSVSCAAIPRRSNSSSRLRG